MKIDLFLLPSLYASDIYPLYNIMKKFLPILLLTFLYLPLHAQTSGYSLIEEFTGENCYPCALYNPAFNTLLKKNTSTVIALKYQCDIPSPGPVLYKQTKADVDTRMYYYLPKSAPYAYTNGNEFENPVNYYTQSEIDNFKTRISSFDITLSHTFSADMDSVFVSMTFTCTNDISTTKAFKAHIVLAEENIKFSTPPGSNGEKNFYMVVRKMYPSASGTLIIKQQWLKGESQTINIAKPLPSYIYNTSELRVVGFIQNNEDKKVLQAAISSYPVGINELNTSLTHVSLFPNPAYRNTPANLDFTLSKADDIKITVTDIIGRMVYPLKKKTCLQGIIF